MKQKIVFFDIDGTVKPVGLPVPESTRAAIRLLRENGHIPVVCTGRTLAAVRHDEVLMGLGFSGMICAAGNHVIYEEKTIHSRPLSRASALALAETLIGCGSPFVLEGPEYLCYDKRFEAECLEAWSAVLGDVPMKVYDPDTDPVQKCIAMHNERIRDTAAEQQLASEMDLLYYDWGGIVEMIPKNTSKATGIQVLIDSLGLSREDTYAFGDGPNDLEMLDYVAHGVAMGNADRVVLEQVKQVTGDCTEDGIWDALKEFGLI